MSTQYGKTIRWSTTGAPVPTGGICENYNYAGRYSEDDHDDNDGAHLATILHDRQANVSWSTKLTDDAEIPVLGEEGAAKVALTGISAGTVLFQEIVETWGLRDPRRLGCSAVHYLDVTGGSTDAATLEAMDAITTPPLAFPSARLAWGTKGVESTLGIIQRLTITQRLRHSPYSEEGKIVTVVTSGYQLVYQLQVLAVTAAARPVEGQSLTLATAPTRFQTGNFIVSSSEQLRLADGVIFDVTARWAPSLAA